MTDLLEKYAEVFRTLDLSELSVEEDGFKLILKKEVGALNNRSGYVTTAGITDGKPKNLETMQTPEGKSKETVEKVEGTPIKSPLLGVFYPDVEGKKREVGDFVKKGDVLCSIEAMKMMNEVKSTVDGVISKVNAKEGDLVEYDQVLFVIM